MIEAYIYNFLRQNRQQKFTARQIANNVNNINNKSYSSQKIACTIRNWSSCYGWNIQIDKYQHPFNYTYV